jgi:tetratricopeptide (TPR) repeat protein
MNIEASIRFGSGLVLAILALCYPSGQTRAEDAPQQFDAVKYQVANAKATKYCVTLWSDHAFDSLRDKVPLLGEPPTQTMLTSAERMRPEDKPLADLHLKAYDKCKAVMRAVWAMLPPAVNGKVLSVARQFDPLNAELYRGKITFGEYNVRRIQLVKQWASAFASIRKDPTSETAQTAVTNQVTHAALAQVDEAAALNRQVWELYNQGRYSEAIPLAQRALTIREKALGLDHPDVAQALNNLAELYQAQGRYTDAEPLDKRALATFEKMLGPDHPNVALSLNNLAVLYNKQGRYADAEPLYKRSLAINEKVLVPIIPTSPFR